MYARSIGDREFTFDFASGLIDDNLLVVDRETNSVWSQLAGKAVFGEMKGAPFTAMPSMQATWKFWREQHPDTRVMVVEGRDGRPYLYQDFTPGERRQRAGEHDTSPVGLGLVVAGDAWYFPFPELEKASTPLAITIGDQQVTIGYSSEGMTAWATDADGDILVTVIAYERGWNSFFPESQRYAAGR